MFAQNTAAGDSRITVVIPTLLAVAVALVYAGAVVLNLAPYWFNPAWTTDDALQQHFPFHKVLDSSLFSGDIITRAMEGYLTPIHTFVMSTATWLTGDPLMAGHWVFLVQLLITLGFIWGAVRQHGGVLAAAVSLAWFLHTRHTLQRMTDGLVRGWAVPVFAAFFYFAARRQHWGMLITFCVGALVHPPATFIICLAYGLLVSVEWWRSRGSADSGTAGSSATVRLVSTMLIAPLVALIVTKVVAMPEDIGRMATYVEALQRPEFQNPGGRFPFVPLVSIGEDFRTFAFQSFLSKWVRLGRIGGHDGVPVDVLLIGGVVLLTLFFAVQGLRRRKTYVPLEAWAFLVASLITYQCSRWFAFKLYVPNRHLQIPMAMFFIVAFSVALARLGDELWSRWCRRWSQAPRWGALIALFFLGCVVVFGSGHGLDAQANFNWHTRQRGDAFNWLARNTPKDSIIAGHPTFIDPVQLFGKRVGYITTETAHPFYDRYYETIAPRIELSLRAHYAPDLKTLYQLLAPEGIDYFVFEKKRFYPQELAKASYFMPFDQLMYTLTRRHFSEYAYRQLPAQMDPTKAPYLVFRDAHGVVIDVQKLGAVIAEGKL